MEQFIPIKNYETYGINKLGECYDFRKGEKMNLYDNGHGYLCVAVRNPQGWNKLEIHKLIGTHFMPNPNNYPTIDHINRDKKNNHIDNLRWADMTTQSNNRGNWNKKTGYKYIAFEDLKTKKNPYSCWRFQVRSKLYGTHSKRFRTDKYDLLDAVKYRNQYFSKYNITIDE